MGMSIQQALEQVLTGSDLSSEQMESVMNIIMQGEATSAQIAGFIIALRMKGECVDELTAAARWAENIQYFYSLIYCGSKCRR